MLFSCAARKPAVATNVRKHLEIVPRIVCCEEHQLYTAEKKHLFFCIHHAKEEVRTARKDS